MKMQGVMKATCTIDLQKHFAKPDYRLEQKQKELEEYRQMLAKEANTTTGAVKRLIKRISSIGVADNLAEFSGAATNKALFNTPRD